MVNDITGSHKERTQKISLRKEKLSSFLYDMAKTVFTVMVVGNLVFLYRDGFTLELIVPIVFGVLTTYLLAWFANRILIY